MKKTKIYAIILFAIALLLLLSSKAYAVSASLSVSSSEIEKGDSVTVTVTASSVAAWDVHVSASGPVSGDGISDADVTADGKNTSKSFSTTYTATDAGTIIISLTGDVTDEDGNNADIGDTKTITVKEPAPVEPEPEVPADPSPAVVDPEPAKDPEPTTAPEPTTVPEPTATPEPTKSSNANLGNLGITPNDFSGFRQGTTSYEVSVPYDVTEIEVYANKLEDSQVISGTGSKSLSEGSNVFDVTVTAEDGTEKTYTITVVRLAKEKTNEPNINKTDAEKVELALASIQIDNVKLNETFKSNVYEYTATADKDAKVVTVKAIANTEGALIEVDAPEEFKDGENVIKITVKEKDGNGKKIYIIKVSKNVEKKETKTENTIVPATAGTTKSNKSGGSGLPIETIIYCIGVVVITALGVLFAVIRYRKDQGYGEEEEEDEFDFVGDISAKEAMIDAAVATSRLAGTNNEVAEEGLSERRKGKHF